MSALRVALVLSGWLVSAAAFSAVSRRDRIVFPGDSNPRFDLFIADADGCNERPPTPATLTAYDPSFSADGTHVRPLTDNQWEESADAWLSPACRQ